MGTIKYKMDIMAALKAAGYSSYVLRDGKTLGQSTQQKLRHGEIVNAANLTRLCGMLHCQPGDLLEYVQEESDKKDGAE